MSLILGLVGCQMWPDNFAAGVDRLTIHEKVRDARAQRITGQPGLRIDSAVAGRLETALATDDFKLAQQCAEQYLKQARILGRESANAEIYRLDDDALALLSDRYFPDRPTLTHTELIAAYNAEAEANLTTAQQRIANAESVADLHRTLLAFEDATETPVKYHGKTARILTWLPFYFPAKIAADRVEKSGPGCPLFLGEFDKANLYRPPHNINTRLERYAPIFVVEQTESSSYGRDTDRIGRVMAEDSDHVMVQTDEPTIYSYARRILLHGREHEQLVYTAWFPRRPALSKRDPLAGYIDGLTVRITLDRSDRPVIVETMANCGCFHGLYPARRLEEAARAAYGPPPQGMRYTLEQEEGQKLHTHIPTLLDFKDDPVRPVIYIAAGWHSIVYMALAEPANDAYMTQTYTLSPYAALELLETPSGGYTSMFYDNGLVRHAERQEGVYFTPLGILSAGQPRQRETQLIYFDRYDFDDPHLLSRLLNLPEDF